MCHGCVITVNRVYKLVITELSVIYSTGGLARAHAMRPYESAKPRASMQLRSFYRVGGTDIAGLKVKKIRKSCLGKIQTFSATQPAFKNKKSAKRTVIASSN
jgi:hypothetical protein